MNGLSSSAGSGASAASASSKDSNVFGTESPGRELGPNVLPEGHADKYGYAGDTDAVPELSLTEMMRLPTEEEKKEEARMLREIDTISGTRASLAAAAASRSRSGPGTVGEEITIEKEILVNQIDEYSRNFDDDSAAEVRRGMVTKKQRKWSSASAAADNRMKFLTGRATAVRSRPPLRPLPKCNPDKSNKFYQALIHNRLFAQALIKRKVLTEGRSFDVIGPMWGCQDRYRVAIMNVLTQAERDIRDMDRAERETFRAMEAQNRLNEANAAVKAAAAVSHGGDRRRRKQHTRRHVRQKQRRSSHSRKTRRRS